MDYEKQKDLIDRERADRLRQYPTTKEEFPLTDVETDFIHDTCIVLSPEHLDLFFPENSPDNAIPQDRKTYTLCLYISQAYYSDEQLDRVHTMREAGEI